MIGFVRSASLIALVLLLAGCKMTLTNRIDVNADGSALVHVITTVDDQLYNLAKSQSKGADPFTQPSPVPGWESTRRVTDSGDHVIEWTRRAGSLSEIQPVLASFYAGAKKSAAQADSMPGLSPASWTFKADETPGLFTRTIHLHVNVPKLMPDTKPKRGDSSRQFGEDMARTMIGSMLTTNTELKLPGKVVSSNGEQLADGRIRFTHSFTAPTTIDVVAEATDTGHVVLAVVAVLGVVVIVAIVVLRRRRSTTASATTSGP